MSTLSSILERIRHGDPQAYNQLLPLIYDELHQLAAQKMAREAPGQTLQATALVHEAYLRLAPKCAAGDAERGPWDSRREFFAAAAEAMQRILIDRARRRGRLKRGGQRLRVELLDQGVSFPENADLILTIDELLMQLEADDATGARVARLHLLGGLSVEEAGVVLGQSRAAAYRHWKFARAWLRAELAEK